jgi:murein L,D-transpeptidase YcbB/YkuD
MRRVFLKNPVPVMFLYMTAFFDSEGNLTFYQDVYNLDKVLIEALKKQEDLSDKSLFVTSSTISVETAK